ncbi:hypothetical protein [Microbacterium sp.]|uniref:hypothetical protein n=1 Tax=Microbacterium sp. TaxID=51671 RepID=UPI00345D7090
MHRHSLRTRVERLAARLDLDLESFPARAELWALLFLLSSVSRPGCSRFERVKSLFRRAGRP